MVKILMHGCNGKMGRMITEIVKNEEDAVIAAGVDKFTGIPNDYPVFEEITQCDVDVDVVIDFSNAGAVDELLDYCVKKSLPVVLCTTGLSDEQLKKVDECSEKIAVLKSANMSMGINLLLKLLKDAAKYLHRQAMILNLLRNTIIRSWMRQAERHLHWQILLMKQWEMNTSMCMTEVR